VRLSVIRNAADSVRASKEPAGLKQNRHLVFFLSEMRVNGAENTQKAVEQFDGWETHVMRSIWLRL